MIKSTLTTILAFSFLLTLPMPVQAQPFDHLECHKVKDSHKFTATVDLMPLEAPPFLPAPGCTIKVKGKELCVPTNKQVQSTDAPIEVVIGLEQAHDFICYKMKCPKVGLSDTEVTDQFGTRTLTKLKHAGRICVPAVQGGPPTTTTTIGGATVCDVTFSMTDAATVGALQYQVDYSAAGGGFDGTADEVSCVGVSGGGGLVAFNDDDGSQVLRSSTVLLSGLTGPADMAVCSFTGVGAPAPGDFVVTVEDSHPATAPGSGSNVCGAPATGSSPPFARDAQEVLFAAVGLETCDDCECDLDDSSSVTATDSLIALLASAGLPTALNCPACVGAPVVTGASASVTVSASSVVCP